LAGPAFFEPDAVNNQWPPSGKTMTYVIKHACKMHMDPLPKALTLAARQQQAETMTTDPSETAQQ